MLKITSFNCRGFKSSVEDIKALFRSSDVLAIQEHWLNPAEFGLINQVDVDVCFSAVSPMEKNSFYSGRPLEVWHCCGASIYMRWYQLIRGVIE